MNRRILISGLVAALVWTTPCLAVDRDEAQTLHDKDCTGCHNTDRYTRSDRKIIDRTSLNEQVRRCAEGFAEGWSKEQISAVAELLNEDFYGF